MVEPEDVALAEGNLTGIAYAEVPPDIEPLDTFYVKDGSPHQAVPRCLL